MNSGLFSFVGAALAVMFFFWVFFSVAHCGFSALSCMTADMDCIAGWCHKPLN